MKRAISVILAAAMLTVGFSGCNSSSQATSTTPSAAPAASEAASTAASGSKNVILISKSFGAEFYQASYKGADDAAKKNGLTVEKFGPDVESNVQAQVDQINAAINKKPAAIILAACDATAITAQMESCKKAGIPVIGFDSGVPGDTTGAVVATAATDNKKAGAVVADSLFQSSAFQTAVKTGTEAQPVIIGVLSQDAISGSIIQRTTGFIDELVTKLNTVSGLANAIEVTGQDNWKKASSSKAKVTIKVTVPPSTSASDVQSAATSVLATKNMIALFGSNQTAVDGILGASSDGSDLTGKYKNIIVVGFDAGKGQKSAIKSKQLFGAVTQDPYNMGFDAVQIAADIIAGKTPANADTGAKWYNSENIADPTIAQLLYD